MFEPRIATEQAEIQEAIRDFARHEIMPAVLKSEHLEDLSCPLPLELVEKASGLGLRTLTLPESQGGAGAGILTCCIAMEELGAGDAGIASTLAQTAMLGRALFDGALTDEQSARFLPLFQSDDQFHLAYISDTDDPDRELAYHSDRSHAGPNGVDAVRQSNGDWVLDGASRVGNNVPVAKLTIVEIIVGDGSRVALMVTPDMPGLKIEANDVLVRGAVEGVLSRRWVHGTSGRLIFSECRIPAANVLLQPGNELSNAGRAAGGSPVFSAINLGVGRSAFEAAVDYAKLRVQGGRRIVEHQAIGDILSSCAIKLEAARNLVWKAAWAFDQPEIASQAGFSGSTLQHMAKVFTAEAVHEVSLKSAECFGAMGVMLDMPLAKYVRDARIFLHWGRSNTVSRFRIAETLAGFSAVG
jgi:alkylation response protein AidB-like acyl-CoA dehydrogenase